jgi:hypothetical protein
MIAVEEHFLTHLLTRRPVIDGAGGDELLVTWARSLVELHDVSTLPLLLDVIDESLEGPRSWDAIDVALDGIVALGRSVAVTTLARLMAHAEVQMRFRAAERLASLEGAGDHLRSLLWGPRPEAVRIAAAWGLAQLGYMQPALRYAATHGALLLPRLVGLGERGVRALCGSTTLGAELERAAALLARKRQHMRLLGKLADDGSELTALALAYINQRPPRAVPTAAEEIEAAGVDLDLLAEHRIKPDPGPQPRESGLAPDPLWRPEEEEAG